MPRRKLKRFHDGLSVELKPFNCPWCGEFHDAATHSGAAAEPEPGNLSLCIRCGSVAVFTESLKLRKPTVAEQCEIDANPAVGAALKAWRDVFMKDSTDA